MIRAQRWYARFGRWSLLGSSLPIVGDPLTLMARVMRTPLPGFMLLVTPGQGRQIPGPDRCYIGLEVGHLNGPA
ncbi:hypothetical protein [Sulfitobacter sp. M368]|uniref:hypothetical protein n=1 Tax=Sulfitobacter sp. M368 TaxID=2867021 RepID=UPI0021A751F0|nr:hypothetical protein [Sulfitobacter sp. M368]